MRKLLAIKINYSLNIYFARLSPRPVRPGPVPKLGTRVEAKIDIRFRPFFGGFGFKPGLVHATNKCCFFLFSFILRKEKSNNKILLSLIRPRVFKGFGNFFSLFRRYRHIIGAPRGDILLLLFTRLP